jgi:hypothetical protein
MKPRRIPLAVLLLSLTLVFLTHNRPIFGEKSRTGLATNANFHVLADSQPFAEELADKANVLRAEIAKEWLDTFIPDGFGPASINVFLSDRNVARTWLIDEDGSRDAHLVWIYSLPENLDAALAHEIAHIVLANRYADLPAFAHEAVASSYDGEERRTIRRDTLQWFANHNRWPDLAHIFAAESIKPSNQAGYATAVSIRDFLFSQSENNRRRFLDFSVYGHKRGWDAALAKFYGFRDLGHFEAEWRTWVIADVVTAE